MDIGESVRLRRTQLRMTQKDLSQKTGIKQPTISAIENGVNKPAIETIVLISDALNCTVSDLVGQSVVFRFGAHIDERQTQRVGNQSTHSDGPHCHTRHHLSIGEVLKNQP